jgi:arylsulfatase A-like enzyme
MRILLLAIAVGAVTLAGMSLSVAPRADAPRGVVVITLDTTRTDRLSPYGFMDVSLPHLERLAREGVLFDQATSVAPLTLPAHTSLFTGLLPPNHGVRDNAHPPLEETQTTLAETLLAHGFRTGAFVGSAVLDPDRGLKQGFEQYLGVDSASGDTPKRRQRRANQVMGEAIDWLDTIGGSRFFLWAHLYDPHRPYDPPEPYASIYGHNLYVGEIAFADSEIGRLLRALERRALLDHTIVVVAGDHGESLGERGERDHGIFIYENVLRVPLIVRVPPPHRAHDAWRGPRPALAPFRIGEVVRLTDVMPTVLDLLNVPAPPADGVSLVDLMSGRRRDFDLEAYSESLYPSRLGWSPLRALRHGRFKLIDAPRPELFDLERDPFEEQNIYDRRRALAEAMTARAAAVAESRRSAPNGRTRVTPELQARLAALGYVGSAVTSKAPGRAADLPDPKDCVGPRTREEDSMREPRARCPACLQGKRLGSRAESHAVASSFGDREISRQRAQHVGLVPVYVLRRNETS